VGATAAIVLLGLSGCTPRARLPAAPPEAGPIRPDAITATVPVGPMPSQVAIGADAVWLASWGGGALLRIDPKTRRVVWKTRVGESQNGPLGVAVGKTAVWVPNFADGRLWAFGRHDGRPQRRIDVNGGGGVAVAAAAGREVLWAACCGTETGGLRGRLTRIDTATARVTARVRLRGNPQGVVVGVGAVWVGDLSNGVWRIDPATASMVERISVAAPLALAVDSGALWVATGPTGPTSGGALVRIDPAGNQVAARFPLVGTPADVAAGDGMVWVTQPDIGELTAVDATSGRITARIPLPGATSVAVSHGAVWVSSADAGTLTLVDPRRVRSRTG
jgi:DNA-binding beta-propeller fold protein YncE